MECTPTTSKTSLTGEQIYELISHYEKHPCLWQKSHVDYKNPLKKADALENIAAESNIKSEIIKDKLRSLRTIYFQNAQKIKKGKSGSAGGMQPRWKFYSALNFLQSEVAESGNIDTSTPLNDTTSYSNPECKADTEATTAEKPPTKKRKLNFDDGRQACWSAIMESLKPQSANEEFGQYVTGSLRQIQNQNLLENAKSQIRLILSKIIIEDCKQVQKRANKSDFYVLLKESKAFND